MSYPPTARRPRRRTTVLALAAATALLTACGGGESAPDAGGGTETGGTTAITVGVIPIVDVAPIYLGVEQGFFEERGLDVTLELAQGGAAIVPAVVSGQFQFGFSNNTSLLLARANSVPLLAVAPGASSTGVEGEDFAGLVVAGDSDIQSPADLAGRTVAINTLNNIGDTVIREAVRQDGGDPSAVQFVELGFPDMPAALASGDVDAVFAVEPFLTITEQQGGRDVASVYARATEDLTVASYFTSEQYAQTDEAVVDAFSEAVVESQQFAADNPDEVRRILGTYTSIDPAVVEQLSLPAFEDEINADSVQALADLALTDGLITSEVSVDDLIRD